MRRLRVYQILRNRKNNCFRIHAINYFMENLVNDNYELVLHCIHILFRFISMEEE